jgi:hypothetical protein
MFASYLEKKEMPHAKNMSKKAQQAALMIQVKQNRLIFALESSPKNISLLGSGCEVSDG